ncbi:hypothetical protein [Aliikangiella sp. IMCC44359]|uniref:hypothetical protein n=1 Tax=Aliikangiella sp. IMCC44359 TaxID=3459125 RepID=UPI00403ACF5D
MKLTNIYKLSPLSLLILAACGGGGTSDVEVVEPPVVVVEPPEETETDVEGLDIPDIISVVTKLDEDTPSSKKSKAKLTASKSSNPYEAEGTDYSNDPVRKYVWDESMEPLQMVNEILCYVGQTRADQLVNQTYTALIDTTRCERESGDDSDEQGQSSGNGEVEYQLWTVESTRESSTSPQKVRIWVPAESDGNGEDGDMMDQQTILVDVTISSSPSDDLPFGDFNMSWKGVVEMNGNEVPTMAGTIQTVENQDGKLQFLFYNGSDIPGFDFSFSEAANVILDDADGVSGIGKTAIHRTESHHEFHSEFSVAYDSARFLRGKDQNNDGTVDAQLCNDRLNMNENVWRYNLYDYANGARKEMNSGFPFTTEVGGVHYDGYMSYWGMWLPESVDKSLVTSITRQDFSDDSSHETYDVVNTPGKLIKRSKSSIPLQDLDGYHFNYWNDAEYLVEYTSDNELNDGTSVNDAGFYKIARVEFSDGQREVIPQEAMMIDSDFMHFYSEALGGSVAYDELRDPSHIVAFREEIISGNDTNLFGSTTQVTLACYNNCLKAALTSEQLSMNQETPYYPDSQDVNEPSVLYRFSLSDLTLRDPDGNAIAMLNSEQTAEGQFSWGIHTGAMILQGTQLDNTWDTYNQDVSFVWETGPNNWNKMTFVRETDATEFLQFDRPMQFLYTHENSQDRNEADSDFAGQSYLLEYGGPGDLWGFPELDSGQHHQRAFSLADATLLANQSGDYVVKGIEMEMRMKELEVTACTTGDNALSLDSALSITLPTASDVATINFSLNDKPTVTDSPRVVGGEIVNE